MLVSRRFLLCFRAGAASDKTVAGVATEAFKGEEVLRGLGLTGNGVTKSKFSVWSRNIVFSLKSCFQKCACSKLFVASNQENFQ
jgi:hypothetical protein